MHTEKCFHLRRILLGSNLHSTCPSASLSPPLPRAAAALTSSTTAPALQLL